MIDGLKLTLSGEELRTLLAARAAEHQASAERWQREAGRTIEEQTEEAPLLPEHIQVTNPEYRSVGTPDDDARSPQR